MIRLYRDPAINSEEKKHRMLNPTRRKKNGFELKKKKRFWVRETKKKPKTIEIQSIKYIEIRSWRPFISVAGDELKWKQNKKETGLGEWNRIEFGLTETK